MDSRTDAYDNTALEWIADAVPSEQLARVSVAAVDDRVFERSLQAGIIHGRRAAAVSPSAVSETWLSPYAARPSPTRW